MSTTVLIVDDNSTIRRTIRNRIEEVTDLQVCGEAANGKVAIDLVETLHPDCVVLDWSMPVMSGLEAAQEISAISPNTKMVLFTLHNFERLNERARQAGISAVLSKDDSGSIDNLLSALRRLTATEQGPTVKWESSDDQTEKAACVRQEDNQARYPHAPRKG